MMKGWKGDPQDRLPHHEKQKPTVFADGFPRHDKQKLSPLNSVLDKTLWDWMELAIIPLVLGLMTFSWNHFTYQQDYEKYKAGLVGNYIDSITKLILDQYHHGPDDKHPEISVEELGRFVRSYTQTTLKALEQPPSSFLGSYSYGSYPKETINLNQPHLIQNLPIFISKTKDKVKKTFFVGDFRHKSNVTNFLREVQIGFAPMEMRTLDGSPKIRERCLDDRKSDDQVSKKDTDYTRFFCEINLTGADLRDTNLSFIILEKAQAFGINLNRANLYNADLEKANLGEAQLEDTNLINANLRDANLFAANLTNALLVDTDFRNSDLFMAKLINANLSGADLSDADLTKADLGGAKLARTLGKGEAPNFKRKPTNLR